MTLNKALLAMALGLALAACSNTDQANDAAADASEAATDAAAEATDNADDGALMNVWKAYE